MNWEKLLEALLNREPAPSLRPDAIWRPDWVSQIRDLPCSDLCRAGLHLLNDDIHSCHELVQQLESPEAAHWHAILHRREGDFENAKYWYRRVGALSILKQRNRPSPDWDPFSFVDACQNSETVHLAEVKLREEQLNEMRSLLEYCRNR